MDRPDRGVSRAEAEESRLPSTYCRVAGELDFFSVPGLEPALMRYAKQKERVVVMDFSGVEYLDAAALHLFERLDGAAKANGTRILFLVSPFHRRILRVVGLDRTLSVFEDSGGEPISRGRLRGEAADGEKQHSNFRCGFVKSTSVDDIPTSLPSRTLCAF